MNYNNQTCTACGKPLAEGEDIVVCPVCATPQHRECWAENGKCANDALHESGYVWKKENSTAPAAEEKTEEENYSVKICHICGSENPDDALHCGNCGALFSTQKNHDADSKKCSYCGKVNADDALHCNQCGAPLGTQATAFFGGTPYIAGTNISADEKIGKNTAGDFAIYTRSSAGRYIKKFKRFENGKKFSFNFGAFFFSPGWFFYRKLYKAGIFFLVAFTTVAILTSNQYSIIENAALKYSEPIESAYTEYYDAFSAEDTTDEELNQKMNNMYSLLVGYLKETAIPYLIFYGSTLVLSLICALIADRLYYKKALEDLEKSDEEVHDPPMKRMLLARKGGTSALAYILCTLGENLLINMLYSAALMIKDLL